MLHDKRDKVLQIRLTRQEWEDLHFFVSVNFGTKFTVSDYARLVLIGNLYESFHQTSINDQL